MLEKLLSRKLWVSLVTIAVTTWSASSGLPWWACLAQALGGVAYVLAEGLVDARRAAEWAVDWDEVGQIVEELVARFRIGLEDAPRSPGLDAPSGDVQGLSAGAVAAINPAIVLAVLQLAQSIVGLFRRRRR